MEQLKPFTLRHPGAMVFLPARAALTGCIGTTKSSSASNSNPPPTGSSVTVKVSPASANVRSGSTQSFSATVTGTANTGVTRQVNGVPDGNSATGTVSSTGLYTSAAALPSPNSVTVSAISAASSAATGNSLVTFWNPMPVVTSVEPPSVPAGALAITVNGSGFVSGAQVLLASAPLATTFVSSTQLKATGSEASAGTYSVSVMNPNPGSATSAPRPTITGITATCTTWAA